MVCKHAYTLTVHTIAPDTSARFSTTKHLDNPRQTCQFPTSKIFVSSIFMPLTTACLRFEGSNAAYGYTYIKKTKRSAILQICGQFLSYYDLMFNDTHSQLLDVVDSYSYQNSYPQNTQSHSNQTGFVYPVTYLHNSNVHLLRFAEIIVPITETDSIILLYRFAGMFMYIVKQKTFSCMSPIQPINTLVLRS